jgi:Tfp pilus assembly protein PilO
VSLTSRDRRIVLLLVPALLVAVYWFLLLAPKRDEATEAAVTLTTQETRRDAAAQRVASLDAARSSFAADYAELVRLGKAVPTTIDMPTILVQLDAAAAGTKIKFTKITADEREPAAAPVAPAPGSDSSDPAAAGGDAAQSGPGTAGESAGNAVADANAGNAAAAEGSGVNPSDTQTSEAVGNGALPVGGGAVSPGAPGAGPVAALDTVPVTLEFIGDFFDLANFFHRIKRYVELSKDDLYVRGRLITLDGIEFTSDPEYFPKVVATLEATAYLAPKTEGATAGATPAGPVVTPASTGDGAALAAPVTPTATATP